MEESEKKYTSTSGASMITEEPIKKSIEDSRPRRALISVDFSILRKLIIYENESIRRLSTSVLAIALILLLLPIIIASAKV